MNAGIRFYGIGPLWVSSASDGSRGIFEDPQKKAWLRTWKSGRGPQQASTGFVLIASGTIASQHTEGSCTAFMDRMRLCFPHTSAPGWQNGMVTDAHSIPITSTQHSAGTILHSRPTARQQKTPAPYPAPDPHCIHMFPISRPHHTPAHHSCTVSRTHM